MAEDAYVPTFSKPPSTDAYVPTFAKPAQATTEQPYVPTFKKKSGQPSSSGTIVSQKQPGGANAVQQVQRGTQRPTPVLSAMPSGLRPSVAQDTPPIPRATAQGPSPILRQHIQASGAHNPPAVSGMWGGEGANAPPGLQPTPQGGVAMPSVPSRSSPSLLQQAGRTYGADIADIRAEYKKQSTEAAGDFGRSLTAKPTVLGEALNALPGGGLLNPTGSAAMRYVFSPLTAATTSTLGRAGEAGERAIGMTDKKGQPIYSKQYIGDLTSGFIPLGEGRMASLAARVEGSRAMDTVRAVRDMISPTAASERAGQAERTIRRATGQGDVEAERAAANLVEHNRYVAHLPVDEQRSLVNYIENKGKGVAAPKDSKLKAAADAISSVYDRYRKRIEYLLKPEDRPAFIADYYSHLWKESPKKVEDTMNTLRGRQGSGRSFKKRTIPTIAEGIQAGLTPRIENPIENTMAYARNMSRYLATHDILNELEDLGHVKWHAPGEQPQGWVPLKGIMTQKARAFRNEPTEGEEAGKPVAQMIQRYAPADVARVYNAYAGQGWTGPIYGALRMASNGLTSLKLGLSGFHAITMANEGLTSEVARAIQSLTRAPGQLLKGEVGQAARSVGRGVKGLATAPAAPVGLYRRGKAMEKQLLGRTDAPDSVSKTVNDAYVRSGQRLHMDPFYGSAHEGSFWNSWRKGTLFKDVADLAAARNDNVLKSYATLVGRTLQSLTAPLFEEAIPNLKRGAFSRMMEDWLHANPGAKQEDIDKQAIQIGDSIDNRFGELVQDNLFWDRHVKQSLQLLLLSPSWRIGTAREIGGGVADIPKSIKGVATGEGVSPRTAYNMALAAVTAIQGAVLTYLFTGQHPKGMDFVAPRTGGHTPQGAPERLQVPGYSKDVLSVWHDPLQYVEGGANPALTAASGLIQNKDYRGLPIMPGPGVQTQPGDAPLTGSSLGDFAVETLTPISAEQVGQRKIGTKIPKAASVMGFRPSPGYVEDPERDKRIQSSVANKAWQRKRRSDQRLRNQEAP